MIYRTDYHIHTSYSDGYGNPEEYIPQAIKKGLSELGFSDHLTLTKEQLDWSINPSLLEEYFREIARLKKKYKNLKIKAGLEIDYIPNRLDDIKNIVESFPLDYVLGSVHYLDGEAVDMGPDYYQEKDLEKLFARYFEVVGQASSTGLFDIMSHLDLVRIFRFSPKTDLSEKYRLLARTFKKSDVAIELNTNGRNKPLNDFYPDPEYLKIFKEEGVHVCVNSDSHLPSRVGQFFDEAYALLLRSGYKEMVTFDKRKRSILSIE